MPRFFFILTAFIFLSAGWADAAAKPMPDFSATLVMVEKGNATRAKYYYTKNKQRMEVNGGGSGGRSVIITRLDREVVWMLMTAEKVYMEMPIEEGRQNPLAGGEDVIKREKLGHDTVDGHPATKEKVSVRHADGSRESMYMWEATDLGWPIKAEAIDGSWSFTYKDIKTGRQDPELFEVPGGYQRMDAPGIPEPDEYPEPPDYDGPDIPEPPEPW